jgi:threonine dehydratase
VGGGGLISGIAVAAKALKPGIEMVGVEAAGYAALYQTLLGKPVEVGGDTIAEGIAVRDIGAAPLALCRTLVDAVVTVEESAIERAIALYLEIEKTVAEGAGAAGLAALLSYPERFKGKVVGLVLCGGNIDTRLLASILMRNLVREGRIIRLRIKIPDRPGVLAKVTALVGEAGANILEVGHQRLFGHIEAKSADLDLVMETRDRAQGEDVIARLTAAGFKVKLLDQGLREE